MARPCWLFIFLVCWGVSASAFWGISKLPLLFSDLGQEETKLANPEPPSEPEPDDQTYLLDVFLNLEDKDDARRACFNQEEETSYQACLALHYQLSYDREPDWQAFEKSRLSRPLIDELSSASRTRIEIVGDAFLTAIFVTLSFASALALFEFVRKISSAQPVAKYLHAWLIDAPPILGICGTLFALIVFLAQINQGEALQLFLPAFSTAAITTLAGGLGAVVNQLLIAFTDK